MYPDLSITKKAYTLLEVLISMAFFGIIALGLLVPFQESFILTGTNQNIVSANSLAKAYLKDTELKWLTPIEFDTGELPTITPKYTENNIYKVTTTKLDLEQNTTGIVILRRVNIKYKDSSNRLLVDLFFDFSRPGASLK